MVDVSFHYSGELSDILKNGKNFGEYAIALAPFIFKGVRAIIKAVKARKAKKKTESAPLAVDPVGEGVGE